MKKGSTIAMSQGMEDWCSVVGSERKRYAGVEWLVEDILILEGLT